MTLHERRIVGTRDARARRRAGAVRSRSALRHRRRRLSGQRMALRGIQPRRARVSAAARNGVRRSSTRTTGRRGSCRSTRRCSCRATRSSAAFRPSSRSTTSRSRASSTRRRSPRSGLGYEVLDVQAMEFWGNISYLKGGINFSEKITTVSPELREGDRAARARFRPRRRPDAALRRSRRHPQRHRHRAAGLRPPIRSCRRRSAPTIFAGKRDAKRALLGTVGLPADDKALARPVVGLDLAADRSEGIRSDCRGGRRS